MICNVHRLAARLTQKSLFENFEKKKAHKSKQKTKDGPKVQLSDLENIIQLSRQRVETFAFKNCFPLFQKGLETVCSPMPYGHEEAFSSFATRP